MSAARLSLHGIGLRLGATDILTDVHLNIQPGARHVIVGHNGAGKSSLLNIIAGSVRPTEGRVMLDGRDITGWPPHHIARTGVTRTWQHPALCESLTVADNLALATSQRHRRQDVNELLHQSRLADHASAPVADLSYGLRRRTEIAVAMAPNPRLLLLDEPSAGLDSAELEALIAQLTTLEPSTTILMTDHNLEVVDAIAHRLTVLHHGKVLTTDTPDQMQANPTPRPQTQPLPRVPNRKPPANGNAVLAIRSLTVTFQRTPILRDIHLDLCPGEIVGLTGGNGAGKSTLLLAIAGLIQVGAGVEITLAGRTIHDLSPAKRAQQGLAIVTQERGIFASLTVTENLRIAHAKPSTIRMPQEAFAELATRLNHKAGNLSGGEQQMLAVARTLAIRPQVLLLDEPFEGLAAPAAARLRAAINTLADAGSAVLLAEHGANVPPDLCTRVLTISNGRLEPGR